MSSGNHYAAELGYLAETYRQGMSANTTRLSSAIAGACSSSIIGVGSGGSFTVASLLCSLHEAHTGRVSRPVTPLEIICNPTLASSSPVFLISAEGKNPDILEALKRARRYSARTIHLLTNRESSKLIDVAHEHEGIHQHVFPLEKKDGYLATNSLLLDSIVIARAYEELDHSKKLPQQLDDLRIGGQHINEWINNAQDFVNEAVRRGSLTIIFSPMLRSIAADLESKLSESALLHCQLADFRSYAHGRHLWLAQRPQDCAILVLVEPNLNDLWLSMAALMPKEIPICKMSLTSASPHGLIAGLIAQMHLVAEIGKASGKDPGRPDVPAFGKNIHYTDLESVVKTPEDAPDGAERSKLEILGARWPFVRHTGSVLREKIAFSEVLTEQKFQAIIFDYDGTLCPSQKKTEKLPDAVFQHIKQIVESNIVVGIASGRGDSIIPLLKESFQACPNLLERIKLGLWNGGWIGNAAQDCNGSHERSEFLSHAIRIIRKLQNLGTPIDDIRIQHPYQISIRFKEGISIEEMWFVLADSLKQAGLNPASMVKSKHSIDVLASGVSKANLIANIVEDFRIDPQSILTVGDQAAWPGNDTALLEHRFSLSVDVPSRRLDRGWKLAPAHLRDVDATLWYLDRMEINAASGNNTKAWFKLRL